MDNTLDPTVVNLAKAIRQTESGGDFSAKGKSGEHGAYQFTPDTWNAEANKYGINVPIEKATPEQQNAVAYNKIKEWKDSGKDVTQIASMWNAGEGEPNAYTGKFGSNAGSHKAGDPSKGTNKFGAKYDVPAYAKSVSEAYLKLKNGEQVGADPNNPSSIASNSVVDTVVGDKNKQPTPPQYTTPQHSPERIAQYKAEDQARNETSKNLNSPSTILGNSITGTGDALSFGGASKLGNELGTGFARSYNQLKGVLGGQDNSKYIPQMDFGNTVKGLAGTVGGVLSEAGGAGELKGILKGGNALENPEVGNILKQRFGSTASKVVGNLPKTEVVNTLTKTLDELSINEANGAKGKAILKALEELNPTQAAKQSLLKRLTKQGISETTRYILYNALGSKLGGIAHGLLPK